MLRAHVIAAAETAERRCNALRQQYSLHRLALCKWVRAWWICQSQVYLRIRRAGRQSNAAPLLRPMYLGMSTAQISYFIKSAPLALASVHELSDHGMEAISSLPALESLVICGRVSDAGFWTPHQVVPHPPGVIGVSRK